MGKTEMKVLVVGGGGREHAIIKKLRENLRVKQVYAAPGNGGISREAVCVDIKATDVPAMVEFALKEAVDFVVVAPDDPLVLGMVDALEEKGIPAWGPNQAAAQIEGSKVFSKNLMKKYGIPTAAYEVCGELETALAYLEGVDSFPLVLKADGLALGKGVLIVQNREEAEEGLRRMMEEKVFGESGSRVVIEEFLTGPEVSVLAFTDGETLIPMVSSMDHKRAYDGNKGPNTGGMGTIAPNPHYTEEVAGECMEKIFLPTIRAMAAEGCPFKGCLYFGLMLTPKGPMVIEYNCRFGDPEAQVVLPLLETDLLEILEAIREERLDDLDVRWKEGCAACVVAASGGYPGSYQTGLPIRGLDDSGGLPGVTVYHAGTKYGDSGFVTAGGRVLGITATGKDLEEALKKAYAGVDALDFSGMQYRKDIGKY